MKTILTVIFIGLLSNITFGQIKVIHVFVALCDNQHQGIVPVSKVLGNGKDPKNNLYWGAAYGVKTYFKSKTTDWNLLTTLKSNNPVLFTRFKSSPAFMANWNVSMYSPVNINYLGESASTPWISRGNKTPVLLTFPSTWQVEYLDYFKHRWVKLYMFFRCILYFDFETSFSMPFAGSTCC